MGKTRWSLVEWEWIKRYLQSLLARQNWKSKRWAGSQVVVMESVTSNGRRSCAFFSDYPLIMEEIQKGWKGGKVERWNTWIIIVTGLILCFSLLFSVFKILLIDGLCLSHQILIFSLFSFTLCKTNLCFSLCLILFPDINGTAVMTAAPGCLHTRRVQLRSQVIYPARIKESLRNH